MSGTALRTRPGRAARPPRAWRAVRDSRWGWLLAVPAVGLIGGFVLYPALNTLLFSFTDFNGLTPASFVGTRQYEALATDAVFHRTLLNSALITVTVTVLLVCLPLPVAYWIHRGIPFRRFFRTVLYLPVVVPIIVSSVAWKWMLDDNGLVNHVLVSLGITREPVSWLSDPGWAIWSVAGVIVWRAFGIYLLIYLAGLATLPGEHFEAAAIDGAGHVRTFANIVVPQLRGSIVLSSVIAFVAAMRTFDEIYVLTGGGPVNASKNTAYYIWESAFSFFKFGYGSAMAVVLLALVLGLVLLGLRLARVAR
ncbi:carbohydrate ABC transporter permease [Microtetraspora niveoalba]|uniref:carbohydrate ABC transporter permease n=1 Tax=Microtetraspora niveoalba TaxID=46175 RepID=UPI000AC166F6|nr:sugar ABC transporter permease [Microtetraspora niveoalba]